MINPTISRYFRLASVLLLLGGSLIGNLRAQNREMSPNMVTAQPGFYIAPYSVYPGNFQLETSVSMGEQEIPGIITISSFAVPSTLARLGVTQRLELRASGQLSHQYANGNIPENDVTFFQNILVGAKYMVISPGEGPFPLAVVTSLRIPRTGSPILGQVYPAPSFIATSSFPLFKESVTGFVNLGLEWSGNSASPTYQYAFAVEKGIFTKTTLYAEAYGFMEDFSGWDHRYDVGLMHLLSPNMQVDLSGGLGFFPSSGTSWFMSGGFSFRLVSAKAKGA